MSIEQNTNSLPPLPPPPPKAGNWFTRHKVATGGLALVAVIAGASTMSGGSQDEAAVQKSAAPASATIGVEKPAQAQTDPEAEVPASAVVEEPAGEDSAAEPAEPAEAAAPELTAGQRNAIDKAESYLSFSAFSRSGLIEQLVFEDFAKKDATFAVDAVDADWMEQAVKKAESYLEYSSFSLSGLQEQLEFEGFTAEQARHGAAKAYK